MKPVMEMAAVMAQIRQAGNRGVTRSELLRGATANLLIAEAIECLRLDGMIYRVEVDRYCITPDYRVRPQISID